jgi:hypothetical protein
MIFPPFLSFWGLRYRIARFVIRRLYCLEAGGFLTLTQSSVKALKKSANKYPMRWRLSGYGKWMSGHGMTVDPNDQD